MKYENFEKASELFKQISELEKVINGIEDSEKIQFTNKYSDVNHSIFIFAPNKSMLYTLSKQFQRDCVNIYSSQINKLKEELDKL